VERLARGKAARAAVPRSAHAGWTLAKAHARSGDPLTISGHLGSGDAVDRTLAAFAQDYADQNDRDYSAFRAAIDSGRLVAQTGL